MLLHKLRMRYGLRWRAKHPPIKKPASILGLITLIVYLGFTTIEARQYAEEHRHDAQKAENASKMLANFLNGGVLMNEEQTVAVKCAHVLDVTNPKSSKI